MATLLSIPIIFPLLGLSHDPETRLEPVNSVPEDVVLISIDLENYEAFNPASIDAIACTQMGIAVFDSELLRDRSEAVSLESTTVTPIQTYLFATGTSGYTRAASRKYVFGEPLILERPSHFLAALYSLLPSNRPFIFIGHNITAEMRALRDLGFEYPPRLLGFSETGKRDSLEKILVQLACPYRGLHCAGNDAHFTLRAFLLLVERGFLKRHPQIRLQDTTARILSAMRSTALAPLPELAPSKPPPGLRSLAARDARETVLQERGAWRADEARFQEEGYADATRWLFQ